jgi:Zn finger protein HypA/HybF involved in hydrogenase expression
MKAIKCELCGSNEFIKEGDYFICKHCRTQYSLENARKMMVEGAVEITGVVQIDKSNEIK